jgi:hypothetical protein
MLHVGESQAYLLDANSRGGDALFRLPLDGLAKGFFHLSAFFLILTPTIIGKGVDIDLLVQRNHQLDLSGFCHESILQPYVYFFGAVFQLSQWMATPQFQHSITMCPGMSGLPASQIGHHLLHS